MPKIRDLSNQKFGKLLVLERDMTVPKGKPIRWICQCECGTIKSIQGDNIKSGLTQSCGCLHRSKVTSDLTNQKIGKLTIIEKTDKRTKNRDVIWKCKCDCGKICYIPTHSLKQQNTLSCGCLKQSKGELLIENFLQFNNISYKKEYVFSDLLSPKKGYLRFDFAVFNQQNELLFLIEYDGETHNKEYVGGWNTFEKVEYQQICDKIKTDYCNNHNISLLRINYKQIKDIEDILKGAISNGNEI